MRYRPIRRNNEFGRVYARGKSYVNQALVLYVLKTSIWITTSAVMIWYSWPGA